jgi:hypothetical protein
VKPGNLGPSGLPSRQPTPNWNSAAYGPGIWGDGLDFSARCPYGVPGDRLYVKEAWRTTAEYNDRKPRDLPDDAPIEYLEATDYEVKWLTGRYRHARFMMRWMSRIALEVTDVRVERLQEISEADAKAEGVQPYRLPVHPARESLRHVGGYEQIWDSINGPGSWAANPWVWVVCFRRLT